MAATASMNERTEPVPQQQPLTNGHYQPQMNGGGGGGGSGVSVHSSDFGAYFVNKLLPHVKTFAYTWFHLQAAKRKHFKNEDKRMRFEDEQLLKEKLMAEQPSVKMKWAVRLLVKIRKDIHKSFQKELVDIISASSPSSQSQSAAPSNGAGGGGGGCHCVLSNPDMKGKMRRIDCLRQSDKVWRLDLVMVVLFKGMPLESSDGERLDKVPECVNPQLCINPHHALFNVRDLEVYLANYINTSNGGVGGLHHGTVNSSVPMNDYKLYCNKNIVSSSVFSPSEFLGLSDVSIIEGASDHDYKTSLVNTSSANVNSHYSDDNDEQDAAAPSIQNGGGHMMGGQDEECDEKNSLVSTILQMQQQMSQEANNVSFNTGNESEPGQHFQTQHSHYYVINQNNKRVLNYDQQELNEPQPPPPTTTNQAVNGNGNGHSRCQQVESVQAPPASVVAVNSSPAKKKKTTVKAAVASQKPNENGAGERSQDAAAVAQVNGKNSAGAKSVAKINEILEQIHSQRANGHQNGGVADHVTVVKATNQQQPDFELRFESAAEPRVNGVASFKLLNGGVASNNSASSSPSRAKSKPATNGHSSHPTAANKKLNVVKDDLPSSSNTQIILSDSSIPLSTMASSITSAENNNLVAAKAITKRRRSSQKSQIDAASPVKLPTVPASKENGHGTVTNGNGSRRKSNPAGSAKTKSSAGAKKASGGVQLKSSVIIDALDDDANGAAPISSLGGGNLQSIEDHSSCSTSSQQDEEIKELLMRKSSIIQQNSEQNGGGGGGGKSVGNEPNPSSLTNSDNTSASKGENATDAALSLLHDLKRSPSITSPSILLHNINSNGAASAAMTNKIADELKELLQKEKQTTADLFFQLLKVQEDQLISNNSTSPSLGGAGHHQHHHHHHIHPVYIHQNSNSNDMLLSDFNPSNLILSSQQQQYNGSGSGSGQHMKSTTPVYVDHLLMSPLFNSFLPCGSASGGPGGVGGGGGSGSNSSVASAASTTSSSSTNPSNQISTSSSSFTQFAAAAVSAAISLNKQQQQQMASPSPSPTKNLVDTSKSSANHSDQSLFKKTNNGHHNHHHHHHSDKPNLSSAKSKSGGKNGFTHCNNGGKTINASLINALRFDSNSNSGFDELMCLNGGAGSFTDQHSSGNGKSSNQVKLLGSMRSSINQSPIKSLSSKNCAVEANESATVTTTATTNVKADDSGSSMTNGNKDEDEEMSHVNPPAIAANVINPSAAPSPTKLPQFYPYAASGRVMHRPIPILQKADAAISTLINNLAQNSHNSSQTNGTSVAGSVSKNGAAGMMTVNGGGGGSSNDHHSSSSAGGNETSKTPADLTAELIKLNNQQQLLSTLRSNSISNNSPLMFNMSINGCNSNIFSNYPNISPANGLNGTMMGGGANNSGSPTSNLFPSITSLFQSPIGTPRVTPTPQHFAAYLFNDDQFHSFILSNNNNNNNNNNSNTINGNGGTSGGNGGQGNSSNPATSSSGDVFLDAVMLSNASNSSNLLLSNFSSLGGNELNMSPLPLFNNLISNTLNGSGVGGGGGHSNHGGLMNTSELSSISNSSNTAASATTAPILSANN